MVSLRPHLLLLAYALALFAAVVPSAALEFDTDGEIVVMNSFGEASYTLNVLTKEPDVTPSVSESALYSASVVSSAATEGGKTNHSIEFTFDKGVGVTDYTISAGEETLAGKIIVAGFDILSDGNIVSGDNGAGVSVGQSGDYNFDVKVVGTDGSTIVLDDGNTKFTGMSMSGTYMEELDVVESSISSEKFYLVISDFRVGTGQFKVSFESTAIMLDDESYETVLLVTQDTSSTPPCVAIGGTYTPSDGSVKVPMFNLLTPPRDSPVEKVELIFEDGSAEWTKDESTLTLPNQTVVFKTAFSGDASISCDGEDGVVVNGPLTIAPGPQEPLATSIVEELDSQDGFNEFTATILIVGADISSLFVSQVTGIKSAFCSIADSTICELINLVMSDGTTSRVVVRQESEGVACTFLSQKEEPEEESAKKEEKIISDFESCDFQKQANYGCDEIRLLTTDHKVAGTPVVAAGGLALWVVIVIAALGAFALIVLIMLGLLFAYRRSAEQSESDYSSSGPLGVPDPSDLLYEQSIVRDIYGRGDFPEGGPSAAVAEQRAREADLREEFPRPPSTSGLSRGTATDDASSTYSV